MNRRFTRVGTAVGECAGTALLACLVASLLAGAAAAAAFISTVEFGPRVGDILAFRTEGYISPNWQIDAVRAADGAHCALEPAVMSTGGGSIVVEQRLADAWTYRVHWAGTQTGNGPGGCGSKADLILALTSLQALVNIAGSGVQRWPFIAF